MAYLTSFNSDELEQIKTEVLVIGSGIAGLISALEVSKEFDVLLITKSELMNTATWYAQGGIASAVSNVDSTALHMEDTLKTGAGLCDKEAVQVVVDNGPNSIKYLQKIGAEFDRIGQSLSLAMEGGHTVPRVIHRKDATGSEVQKKLVKAVLEHKGIRVIEKIFAIDLLVDDKKCYGLLAFDGKKSIIIWAPAVILATGGAGQLYSQTTNPPISTGDGVAMACRSGATLMDMEFVQFHPTSLHQKTGRHFLITEALRGAGAFLINEAGERFMAERHPKAELAPRDIISQEIVKEMKRFGKPYVYLDVRHIGHNRLLAEFPYITDTCLKMGYDISSQPLPVSPVAHFLIGGIRTDLQGHTDIEGLFAAGECACTGLHGANRLASNSLLEGIVFSRLIAKSLKGRKLSVKKGHFNNSIKNSKTLKLEARQDLKQKMWDDAGIIRNAKGLKSMIEFCENYTEYSPMLNAQSLELKNMITLAEIISKKALERKESRGVHFRMDYPFQKETYKKHSCTCTNGYLGNKVTKDPTEGSSD